MSVINNANTLQHISGKIWLSRVREFKEREGSQPIYVCIEMDNGEFGAVECLQLDLNGDYYRKDKKLGGLESSEFIQYITELQGGVSSSSTDITPPKTEDELYVLISEVYAKVKSIKKAAKMIGISEERARRILFTTGDYTCDTHDKIMAMLRDGKSLDEIAPIVGVARNKIHAYLPYTRNE